MQIRNISLASKNSNLFKYERYQLRSETLPSEKSMVTLLIKVYMSQSKVHYIFFLNIKAYFTCFKVAVRNITRSYSLTTHYPSAFSETLVAFFKRKNSFRKE
ncbi:UNVERIFIED_CONTAM: hypothetical protein K2H54_034136 [Gekko kuhli]